jgi:indole-3-acetate monooxygenase
MQPRDPSTVSSLLGSLQSLAPLVQEHRQAIEHDRRLPAPLFTALADQGLFRLWLPKSLGGPELSPADFMTVVEAAAALDGSIAWVVGNGGGASRVAGYVAEDVARDWFGDQGAFIALATGAVGEAQPVDGGYRVSGRWPFGSGIHGATGAAGICAVQQGDATTPPRMIMCYMPIGSVTVIDNWHVSGLRGTGSCDWTANQVIVPEEHVFSFPEHRPMHPGPIYRAPLPSTFTWSVAVVPLGIARALLDSFIARISDRTRLGTSQPLREREIIQSEVGRADAMIRAGRSLLNETMQALIDAVAREDSDISGHRVALQQAASFAADAALKVASMVEAMAGTAAISEAAPIARQLRDLRASAQHIAMSPANFITAGRVRLGLDIGTRRS